MTDAGEARDDELQQRSELLRITLSSIGDAVLTTDREGRVTFLNLIAESLTGWTNPEAVGRPLGAVFNVVDEPPPSSSPARTVARAEDGGRGRTGHGLLIARDGTRRPIDDSAAPIRDRDGAVVGSVIVFRDISERRRAEAEQARLLREVEAGRQRLVEVFRSAPSFMAILRGPDHVFELANDRYYELIGRRDILGQTVREALPEVVEQGFVDLLDSVYRSGEPFASGDMRVMVARQPGGPLEERFLDFVYQPLRDAAGAVTGILAQGIDLTEHKRAQAELHRRDERLQLLLGNATDFAVIISDLEGRVLEWQGGAEHITGWTAEDMIGRPASVIFTPEERAAGVPEAEMAKAAQSGRAEDKRWHARKDGRRFFADGVMVGLRNAEGELRGFGKVMRDATDRKQAEDALKEADRRKDEFLAVLAHELRNPLAPLRNGLQIMRLAAHDTAAVNEARDMMERQLGHMVRLIDDLLDVSRISRNKMELRRQRVLLSDVVTHSVETARPLIDAQGHALEIDLPAEPIYLDADLTRLSQVFGNLLANSAKYTPRGGRIALHGERDHATVMVQVRDTGIGIPQHHLPRVFDMFSQVDRSIERAAGGLGIGLALVKGLVEMHGGAVTAASEGPDRGSTFTVRLPIAEAPAVAPAGAAATASAPEGAGARRILVVDDNRDAAASLASVLGLLGDEVRVAHDGIEAIEAAARFRPDVILMDVGMPRMNGYDATRRIRAQPGGGTPVIVALTGWGQERDRVLSSEAGCDAHLVKPVNLDELQELLSRRSVPAVGEKASD